MDVLQALTGIFTFAVIVWAIVMIFKNINDQDFDDDDDWI